jgi:hypothetical protein
VKEGRRDYRSLIIEVYWNDGGRERKPMAGFVRSFSVATKSSGTQKNEE